MRGHDATRERILHLDAVRAVPAMDLRREMPMLERRHAAGKRRKSALCEA